jgi:diketogulonate reductase-like aldo/keto reductase
LPAYQPPFIHFVLDSTDQNYCKANKIFLASYAPLTGLSELPSELKAAVEAAATHHNVSPAMILLRWNLQTDHIVITTSTKPSRCETLTQVYDFTLTEEEVKAISEAGKQAGENRVFWRKAWGME